MRNIFLLALFSLLSLACSHVEANKKIKAATVISQKPAEFVCNYSQFKLKSQKLLEQYRTDPVSINKEKFLTQIRDSLFTCWLGTPWDFNGTTEEPNNGNIACGYFVTTLLRDMGFKLNRVKLAQCASEEMIKTVCVKNTLYRSSNEPIAKFIEKINDPGLYVVGLDFHTGFILNDGNNKYFIHANYAGNKVVEKEIAVESSVLATSKYKVIGKVI